MDPATKTIAEIIHQAENLLEQGQQDIFLQDEWEHGRVFVNGMETSPLQDGEETIYRLKEDGIQVLTLQKALSSGTLITRIRRNQLFLSPWGFCSEIFRQQNVRGIYLFSIPPSPFLTASHLVEILTMVRNQNAQVFVNAKPVTGVESTAVAVLDVGVLSSTPGKKILTAEELILEILKLRPYKNLPMLSAERLQPISNVFDNSSFRGPGSILLKTFFSGF